MAKKCRLSGRPAGFGVQLKFGEVANYRADRLPVHGTYRSGRHSQIATLFPGACKCRLWGALPSWLVVELGECLASIPAFDTG